MKKILFINSLGALFAETTLDNQVNMITDIEFYPGVFRNLHFIRHKLDYELVSFTNNTALPVHEKALRAFAGEDILFDEVLTDVLFEKYLSGEYDLMHSYVIGNGLFDVALAKSLGAKAILLNDGNLLDSRPELKDACALATRDWDIVTEMLYAGGRKAVVQRKTNETDIYVSINLDGNGICDISTGLGFFDHLLEQIGRHSGIDLCVSVSGDLHVDEHHTIEDTALALGEALNSALGDKRGIGRYGFCLPMDDCLCTLALDFGGRPWLVWDAQYKREKIGDMPAEMFSHFFKSLSDAAKINLNIKAEGANEHHKIECTFKAFARALKMAVKRDINHLNLPSTKGII